jgi:hypothetical protein
MSSTNRGAERRVDDAYLTPAWCVRRLLEAWTPGDGILVEPAVGPGRIVDVLPGRDWVTCDIQPTQVVSMSHHEGDFLELGQGYDDAAAVITNPPYSLAEEFVRHSRELYPHADLVFLLRIAFLASDGRQALWRDLGTPDLYVLPNRPSFTGKGTDSADYAWFVWPRNANRADGGLKILDSTPASERKTADRRQCQAAPLVCEHMAPIPSTY